MNPHDLLRRLPSSTSMGVVLLPADMPALRDLREKGLAVRHAVGWRRTPKGDAAVADPLGFGCVTWGPDFDHWEVGAPCPPVTKSAPTTIPCAASAPRKRPFPVWLAVALGFGLGVGVAWVLLESIDGLLGVFR